MRLFNPVDLLSGGIEPPRKPPLSGGRADERLPRGPGDEFTQRSNRPAAPVRATHATERARRQVRKIAVATFGRGKTTLDYRYGHWFVHVYGPDGRAVASFVAVDRSPGAFGSGIDLVPAP